VLIKYFKRDVARDDYARSLFTKPLYIQKAVSFIDRGRRCDLSLRCISSADDLRSAASVGATQTCD